MYNVVSENYSIYLNNVTNYTLFFNRMTNYSDYLLSKVTNGDYIGKELREDLENYPKFPYNFLPISNITDFDIYKIYSATRQPKEVLSNLIPNSLLPLKHTLDQLPPSRDKFFSQLYLQKIFIEDITNNNFNANQNLLGLLFNVEDTDFFYKSIGSPTISNIKDVEFFQQAVHSIFIPRQIDRFTNIFDQFSDYYYSSNLINHELISNSFNLFFDNQENLDDFLGKLSKLIIRSIYGMLEYTNEVESISRDAIYKTLEDLESKFSNFVQFRIDNLRRNIFFYFRQLLINYLTVKIMENQCDTDNYSVFYEPGNYFNIWGNINISEVDSEEDFIGSFLDRITSNNLNDYMYLWFSYNRYPEKFLNILPMITKKMINDFVFTSADRLYLRENLIEGILRKYPGKINFEEYSRAINDTLTADNLESFLNDEKISKMALFLSVVKILDDFLNSKDFNNYIYNLLFSVFNSFKQNGYIRYDFDWYKEHITTNLFFETYLKNSFFNDKLFNDIVSTLDNYFLNLINNDFSYQEDELITENASSSTRFFTDYKFDDDSITVYLDGVEVSSSNYYTDGSNKSIIFDSSPSGDVLKADYQIYYSKEFGSNSSDLESRFQRFSESRATSKLIQNFMNNIYETTIIKQVYLNILSNYQTD